MHHFFVPTLIWHSQNTLDPEMQPKSMENFANATVESTYGSSYALGFTFKTPKLPTRFGDEV